MPKLDPKENARRYWGNKLASVNKRIATAEEKARPLHDERALILAQLEILK